MKHLALAHTAGNQTAAIQGLQQDGESAQKHTDSRGLLVFAAQKLTTTQFKTKVRQHSVTQTVSVSH